jgi:hypothetical protein
MRREAALSGPDFLEWSMRMKEKGWCAALVWSLAAGAGVFGSPDQALILQT